MPPKPEEEYFQHILCDITVNKGEGGLKTLQMCRHSELYSPCSFFTVLVGKEGKKLWRKQNRKTHRIQAIWEPEEERPRTAQDKVQEIQMSAPPHPPSQVCSIQATWAALTAVDQVSAEVMVVIRWMCPNVFSQIYPGEFGDDLVVSTTEMKQMKE